MPFGVKGMVEGTTKDEVVQGLERIIGKEGVLGVGISRVNTMGVTVVAKKGVEKVMG